MKLLLDQNLSRRLVVDLRPLFAGITHVTFLSMAKATTGQIWEFARDNGYAIVSKDVDFHH